MTTQIRSDVAEALMQRLKAECAEVRVFTLDDPDFPNRVCRQLAHDGNTSSVFWSSEGNSFVMVPRAEGRFVHKDTDERCDLLSINGIGEVRWPISQWDKDRDEHREVLRWFRCESWIDQLGR